MGFIGVFLKQAERFFNGLCIFGDLFKAKRKIKNKSMTLRRIAYRSVIM